MTDERPGERRDADNLPVVWTPRGYEGPPAWPADLAEYLVELLSRFVVLTRHQADLLAAWVLHTHVFEAFDCTPYIQVTAPTSIGGKSTLVKVLRLVVARAWMTYDLTPAKHVSGDRPAPADTVA